MPTSPVADEMVSVVAPAQIAAMATAGIVAPVPTVPGATVIVRFGRLRTVPTVRCAARVPTPAPGPTVPFATGLTGLRQTHETSPSA